MGQFLNSREPYDKYRTVILELKVDHTPEEAIAQIKGKDGGKGTIYRAHTGGWNQL